jgi:hypothetical protein
LGAQGGRKSVRSYFQKSFLLRLRWPKTRSRFFSPAATLIVPKHHVADYLALYQLEINAINQLLTKQKASIVKMNATVTGIKIGMNCKSRRDRRFSIAMFILFRLVMEMSRSLAVAYGM